MTICARKILNVLLFLILIFEMPGFFAVKLHQYLSDNYLADHSTKKNSQITEEVKAVIVKLLEKYSRELEPSSSKEQEFLSPVMRRLMQNRRQYYENLFHTALNSRRIKTFSNFRIKEIYPFADESALYWVTAHEDLAFIGHYAGSTTDFDINDSILHHFQIDVTKEMILLDSFENGGQDFFPTDSIGWAGNQFFRIAWDMTKMPDFRSPDPRMNLGNPSLDELKITNNPLLNQIFMVSKDDTNPNLFTLTVIDNPKVHFAEIEAVEGFSLKHISYLTKQQAIFSVWINHVEPNTLFQLSRSEASPQQLKISFNLESCLAHGEGYLCVGRDANGLKQLLKVSDELIASNVGIFDSASAQNIIPVDEDNVIVFDKLPVVGHQDLYLHLQRIKFSDHSVTEYFWKLPFKESQLNSRDSIQILGVDKDSWSATVFILPDQISRVNLLNTDQIETQIFPHLIYAQYLDGELSVLYSDRSFFIWSLLPIMELGKDRVVTRAIFLPENQVPQLMMNGNSSLLMTTNMAYEMRGSLSFKQYSIQADLLKNTVAFGIYK